MFTIGQIFEKTYPIQAIEWCNENNCYMETIEPTEDGINRFQILEQIEYTPPIETEEERKARINALTLPNTTLFKEVLRTSGKTKLDIQALIQSNINLSNFQKESLLIDLQGNSNFIRGSYFVVTLGTLLNYTTEQLDYLFEHRVFNF